MAAPKLDPEQRGVLLTWLAAEYSESLIFKWFADREWPSLSSQALNYYRNKYRAEIDEAREMRRSAAITTGLALKEERIERLKDHADELEAIKWLPDKNGRLWNESAWREVLDDIAKEMGHRRTGLDLGGEVTFTDARERLAHKFNSIAAATEAGGVPDQPDR